MSVQSNWGWCNKCQCVAFMGSGSPGNCAAGGNHDHTGSGNYVLTQSVAPNANQQDNWQWCKKCQCLAYAGGGSLGPCPAGGTHDHTGSGDYVLTQNKKPTGALQGNWQWCNKCQCLAFAGSASLGPCPAGGTHDHTGSGSYVIGQSMTSVAFTSDPLTFSGGTALGGSAQLTINPDGSYVFSGGWHDSGLIGYDESIVWGILDADNRLYTFARNGSVGGTLGGSRDDPWNITGTSADIANNWASICAAGPQSFIQYAADVDWGSLFNSLMSVIKTTVTVVEEVITVAGPILAAAG